MIAWGAPDPPKLNASPPLRANTLEVMRLGFEPRAQTALPTLSVNELPEIATKRSVSMTHQPLSCTLEFVT